MDPSQDALYIGNKLAELVTQLMRIDDVLLDVAGELAEHNKRESLKTL